MFDFLTRHFRSTVAQLPMKRLPTQILSAPIRPKTMTIQSSRISNLLTTGAKTVGLGIVLMGLSGSLLPAAAISPLMVAQADAPPVDLVMMLKQIDQAASAEDLATVMAFYSPDLQHGDGLTAEDLETMLTNFWQSYDNLAYTTELLEWEAVDGGFVTTTLTTVTGEQAFGSDRIVLEATLESQQQVQNGVIVEQTVLAEQSQVTMGSMPPTVDVQLPEAIAIGQPFYFDAIVEEPIGESLLMGAAFVDSISSDTYTMLPALELEVLDAGGLFKQGEAPLTPGQQWVSGVLVREGGLTAITQRLRVVNLSELPD